jgi:hypothetical protein
MKSFKKLENKSIKNIQTIKGGNNGVTYVEHHNPNPGEGQQEFEVSVDPQSV